MLVQLVWLSKITESEVFSNMLCLLTHETLSAVKIKCLSKNIVHIKCGNIYHLSCAMKNNLKCIKICDTRILCESKASQNRLNEVIDTLKTENGFLKKLLKEK